MAPNLLASDARFDWRGRVILIALLGMALAVFAGSAAAQVEIISFDDCTPQTLKTLRARIYLKGTTPRPIVLSRDVLHLSLCIGQAPGSESPRLMRTLHQNFQAELRQIEISSRKSMLSAAARDACGGMKFCVAEIYRRTNFVVKDEIIPFAKSGGLPFAQFLGHAGDAGHYEITQRALAALTASDGVRWTEIAAEILRDASRDADFYEWSNPAAHAQTRNDAASAEIDETDADARTAFVNWVSDYLMRARSECRAGNMRNALYFLGYALHGVQDLVFHEGITNAEHSYRDFVEKLEIDGDGADHTTYILKMALAVVASEKLLRWFRAEMDAPTDSCWGRMTDWRGDGPLTREQKLAALSKREMDFGVVAYWNYKSLSDFVEKALLPETRPKSVFFIARPWLDHQSATRLDEFLTLIQGRVHETK